jgi:hypothetical protein
MEEIVTINPDDFKPSGVWKTKPKSIWYYRRLILKNWWRRHNPFNLRVRLYNKHHSCVTNAPNIGYDDRYFYLLQDNGEKVKGQISLTIHDEVNKPTTATVVLHINTSKIIDLRENNAISTL